MKGSPFARMAVLLAASLPLVGCSLSMPEERELFTATPTTDGDAGQLDGSMDAASGDDGGEAQQFDSGDPQSLDGGATAEAGSDAATPADAGQVADTGAVDAAQDAGPTVFDPENGLVLHYRFNESTGNTVNDFASSKDAIVVGTPAGHEQWVSAGRVGGALRLAGTPAPDGGVGHHVELPQGVLLGLDQCTIALWMNRSGGPVWQRVFDLGSGQPAWIYFTANGATNLPIVAGRTPALIFVDYLAIPEAPAGEGQLKVNQAIPVSTWVHVTLTWSAAEMKLYLNGKLVAQTVTHAQITPTDLGNTTQNYLGRSQFAPDPYYNGMLDEFRIYDRALTASEVTQLYELD